MAHLENYKRGAIGHMLDHYAREENDGVDRSNENIDPARTGGNYVLAWESDFGGKFPKARQLRAAYRERIKSAVDKTNEVRANDGKKPLYKSAAVMSDWVVTLPGDCPPDKMREFFKNVVGFIARRYGRDSVLGGFVHVDETTPHVHVPVLPLMEDGTLDRARKFNRGDLRTFHEDLQEYMDEKLGMHVSVLLDEEDLAAKAKSKLTRAELDALNKEIKASVAAETATERENLRQREKALATRETGLSGRENALNDRESTLKESEAALERGRSSIDERKKQLDERERVLDSEVEQRAMDLAVDKAEEVENERLKRARNKKAKEEAERQEQESERKEREESGVFRMSDFF